LVFFCFEKENQVWYHIAMEIKRVEGDILQSNVFVVSEGGKCILIDAGAPIERVMPYVDEKSVEAIFLTHGHYDHIYYLNKYVDKFRCEVYASEKITDYLYDKNHNASYDCPYPPIELEEIKFLQLLSGDGVVDIAGFKVEFFQLGGHSSSDMMFQLGDDLFVGDEVIGRDVGRTDLWGGDKQMMLASLQKILQKDYQIMHCGHGQYFDKKTQDKVVKLWHKFLSR